jgi:Xaa-Pro aminopeptidase
MKYHPIDAELFVKNRSKLAEKIKTNSVVIIHSNDVFPTNADGTMAFRQNANLLYLTGIEQEETILVLAPDHPNEKLREVLFLRKTNEHIAVWEGHKFTKEEARVASGIQNVKWVEDFDQTLLTVLSETENIYLETNEHIRNGAITQTRNDRFIQECKLKYPMHEYHRLAPVIYALRSVKSAIEIDMIQTACDITEKGFRRILASVKPGVWEFEVEADLLHEFQRNRSRRFAYEPIIAGGANSCVLHYIENDKPLRDGDILLMDVAAEYANYHSDMTRTIPVGGKYSKRQRQIYDAVLRVKNAATELLAPGNAIPEYHHAVGELMEKELLDLGLIDKTDIKNQDPDWPAYKKYFMHGTSHHLGLDVHDVASIYAKFEPGMVFTVEPGIYVPAEGIGVRLEDNIVINKNGHTNLMANIPIEADEIEELMNQ